MPVAAASEQPVEQPFGPLQIGLAAGQLAGVHVRASGDLVGHLLEPGLVAESAAIEAAMALVVGEIEMVGVVGADVAAALADAVVPANEVDSIVEIVAIGAVIAAVALVPAPG